MRFSKSVGEQLPIPSLNHYENANLPYPFRNHALLRTVSNHKPVHDFLNLLLIIHVYIEMMKIVLTTGVPDAELYVWGYSGLQTEGSTETQCSRPLAIAAMNAELIPFEKGEHNSESTSTLDRGLTPLITCTTT